MKEILLFGAETCGPCQMVKKRIYAILEANEFDFEFKEIDVYDEKNENLLDKYRILNLPTLIGLTDKGEHRWEKINPNEILRIFAEFDNTTE